MALPKPKGIQLEVLDLKPIGHNVVLGTAGSGKTTLDRKSTRLNSSHTRPSRMPSSA